jgi:hypothetical protein
VALMAAFEQRFTNDRRLYGEIELSAFGPTSGPVTLAGTADLVLFMRNIHAWGSNSTGSARKRTRTRPPRTAMSRRRS